jgi:hypothetical protein
LIFLDKGIEYRDSSVGEDTQKPKGYMEEEQEFRHSGPSMSHMPSPIVYPDGAIRLLAIAVA